MIDAANSYRCKVCEGNSKASLQIGRRRFQVDVMELSRDTFCIRLAAADAKKVKVGGKSKLYYQEMIWSVLCTQKWFSSAEYVELELKQLEELTPINAPKSSLLNQSKCSSAMPADNTLPIAFGVSLIAVVLIMPAWGGQWGTSDAICSAVSATWTAVGQLVTGQR